MATVKRFEDLEVWKKARVLAKAIHIISFTGKFEKDFKLRDQIGGSSGSTMDNIAEGFERGGKAEFINFLTIAKGSNAEVKSQLYRALDKEYINQEKFEELYNMSDEIGKMLNGLITYLNSSDVRGQKFKNRV